MTEERKSTNLADEIFDKLRRQILGGDLIAGERLPAERELATQFNTNRNTLREAIRKLEQMRLVTVRHGQGVTVSDFRKTGTIDLLGPFIRFGSGNREKLRMMADLLPARTHIFEYMMQMVADRADDQDMERLRSTTQLVLSAVDNMSSNEIANAYYMWFDNLVDATHSTPVRWIANPLLEVLRSLLDDYAELWLREPSFPAFMSNILDALEAGDAETAGRVTREYFERVDASVIELMDVFMFGAARPQSESNNDS